MHLNQFRPEKYDVDTFKEVEHPAEVVATAFSEHNRVNTVDSLHNFLSQYYAIKGWPCPHRASESVLCPAVGIFCGVGCLQSTRDACC